MMITCQRCGKECQRTGRFQKYCPDCRKLVAREQIAAWRKSNPERVKAYNKKWCEKNRDHVKELQKEWRAKNPEYDKLRQRKKRQLQKLEAKKLRFRTKIQAIVAKRQAEQLKHKELYQTMNHWDDELGIFISEG